MRIAPRNLPKRRPRAPHWKRCSPPAGSLFHVSASTSTAAALMPWSATRDTADVSTALLNGGWARSYDGGRRGSWC